MSKFDAIKEKLDLDQVVTITRVRLPELKNLFGDKAFEVFSIADHTLLNIKWSYAYKIESGLLDEPMNTAETIKASEGNILNKMWMCQKEGGKLSTSHMGASVHFCNHTYDFDDKSLITFKTNQDGQIYMQTQDKRC